MTSTTRSCSSGIGKRSLLRSLQITLIDSEPFHRMRPGRAIEEAFVEFWADRVRHHAWRFSLLEARVFIVVSRRLRRLRDRAPGLTHRNLLSNSPRSSTSAGRQKPGSFLDALETLDKLRDLGVKLALYYKRQRYNPAQEGREVRPCQSRFDHIQIEGEAGFGKPEAKTYQHAMDVLGVTAAETWMVGDNLEWEVVAPQKLGIYSIWNDFSGKGLPAGSDIKPDRIIRLISELV